jgi:hypothetical protein
MKSAISTLITYIIGAVVFTVLLKPDKNNWPMVLIAAAFPTMFVYMWRNRKNIRWHGAGQDESMKGTRSHWEDDSPSRGQWDATSMYSNSPGGVNDSTKWD